MRASANAALAILILLSQIALAEIAPATSQSSLPNSRSTLSPDDSRQVGDLVDQISGLRVRAHSDQAIPLAEQVLALRLRNQRADWWQVEDARRLVEDLREIATLSTAQQASLAGAESQEGDRRRDEDSNDFAPAIKIIQHQIEVR